MSLVATFAVDTANQGDGGSNKGSKHNDNHRPRLRHSIYIGGKTDAKDYDKIVNRWKITHVLNCTPPKQTNIEAGVPNYFQKPKTHQKQLVYHRVPIYDSQASLPELKNDHESKIIQFIAKGLCHGNVLVHCSRGVSRSTTSIVLYLMAKRGYTYVDALSLIRRRRPEAQPIPAFDEWLKERSEYYFSKFKEVDRNDTTIETAETTRPTKKAKQAPNSGASIGPALPPSSTTPKEPSIRPSIGPSPPSIGPEPPPRATTTTTKVVGPEPPPKELADDPPASIGPELPPGATVETKRPRSPVSKPSIGPELPP